MDEGFNTQLIRIMGASKCTKNVVRALYYLTSGRVVYLDGIRLGMLQTLLPAAVSKSVYRSLQKCERFMFECILKPSNFVFADYESLNEAKNHDSQCMFWDFSPLTY
jgi:hypothetical protein